MKQHYQDRVPDEMPPSRRRFLAGAAGGFGLAALASLLSEDGLLASDDDTNPLRPRPPHFPASAQSGIFIFLVGGTSQVDLFDPKPTLEKLHGQPIPESFRQGVRLGQTTYAAPVMRSAFKFRRYGRCGMEMSELLPQLGSFADDLTLVRSMH